jgi:hypothetical protein
MRRLERLTLEHWNVRKTKESSLPNDAGVALSIEFAAGFAAMDRLKELVLIDMTGVDDFLPSIASSPSVQKVIIRGGIRGISNDAAPSAIRYRSIMLTRPSHINRASSIRLQLLPRTLRPRFNFCLRMSR